MEFMTGVKTTDLLELAELQNKELIGQTVKVNGAVHTIRDMGDVAFVVLRKRDGLLQCVYEEGKSGSEASRSSPLRVHPCRFRLQNGN